MRRFTSVLLSIFLGALAVAIGMGFFLQKANADRAHLADVAIMAQDQVKEAQQVRDQAVTEANRKLDAANFEIKKAQDALTALKQERDLITNATNLHEPTPRELKGWKQSIDLPLGVSIKYPSSVEETANDKSDLVLSKTPGLSSSYSPLANDLRWLSVQSYDETKEQALLSNLSVSVTSTPFSYLINGHLLIGTQATLPGTQQIMLIAHASADGQKTHLLWAKVPSTEQKDLLLALRTLDFKQ